MARAPDPRIEQAEAMYRNGIKLVDIASQLNLPEGTVRRWKCTHKWDGERSEKKSERSEKKKNAHNKIEKVVAEEVAKVMDNPNLTDKQRLFCLHYVKCFNATKAYQKAYGCSYETAMVEGWNALRNPKIIDEIRSLKQNRLNRELLDEQDIFQKYMDIAFADITDYVEFRQEEVQVMAMYGPVYEKNERGEKVPVTKRVNTVKFKDSAHVDGTLIAEVKQGKDGASIKLADKMKALDWLSSHMDLATAEQRARIAEIEAQTKRLSAEPEKENDDGVNIINDVPGEERS